MIGAGTITKKDGALFGPPDANYIKTVKRMEADNKETESYKTKYMNRSKAGPPSKEDMPIMGIRSTKNFVVANAVEAILQGLCYVLIHVC